MIKLNLGCGSDIRDGWENYDKYPVCDKVKKIDLNVLPLPLPDNYANEILLKSVFEHLSCNQFEFMKEMNRILKKGGRIIIDVPSNRHLVNHERGFFTCDYFNNLMNESNCRLFSEIRVKSNNNTISDIIWKLKLFISWILKRNYIFELKK